MTNNVVVIIYHSNVTKIYKQRWTDKMVNSILNQSYDKFDIWELDYGMENGVSKKSQCGYTIINNNISNKHNYKFFKKPFENHIYAQQYLINKAFEEGYEYVVNTNVDDFYHPNRIEKQLNFLKNGYDIVFSCFRYIKDVNDIDVADIDNDKKQLFGDNEINEITIKENILKDHNVLCHPSACYSKNFWTKSDSNKLPLKYKNDVPYEDLILWKKCCMSDVKIGLMEDILVYYRLHKNQVSSNSKQIAMNTVNPTIGILMVCTGRYVNYCEETIKSIEKHFLKGLKKIYYFFTNDVEFIGRLCKKLNIEHYASKINHRGFPADTLYRYNYFLLQKHNLLLNTDVIFYFDVDMKVVNDVEEIILPTKDKPFVVAEHNMMLLNEFHRKSKGTPEINPISTACIDISEDRPTYVVGGFNGGITSEFLKMAKHITKNVDVDDENEFMAVWHDESHLNRYYTSNYNKFNLLDVGYCYPERATFKNKQYILALEKNHFKVRTEEIYYTSVDLIGGLGNKMFMAAGAYSYAKNAAKKFNVPFKVMLPILAKNAADNDTDMSRRSSYRNSFLSSFYRYETDKIKWITVKEDGSNYNNFEYIKNNVMLEGYFQSYKYFNNFRDEILEIFRLPKNKQKIVNKIYNSISNLFEGESVSMHFRRTDYVTNNNDMQIALENEYYLKAIQQIKLLKKNAPLYYVVFSDDIEYCKQQPIFKNLNVYFVDQEYANYIELSMMSKCNHNIIANSSFSWWSAYLNENKNKIVTYPKNWYGSNLPKNFDINDMCLPEWIGI